MQQSMLLTALIGSALLPPARLAAQQVLPLFDGAVVRVWTRPPALVGRVGTVVRQGKDTLWLEAKGPPQPLAVPVVSIDRLDRQAPAGSRGGHVAAGAALGLVTGALLGGVIGYSTTCGQCGGDWRPFGALLGGAAGGLVGSLAGGIIGAIRLTSRWEPVVLEGR